MNKTKLLTELKSENELLLSKKIANNNFSNLRDTTKENYSQIINYKNMIELNSSIIQERNEEIEEIFRDVLCIKDIFAELNNMVVKQDEPIKEVEKNIELIEKKVEQGVQNLTSASYNYNLFSSTRNKFILLSALGIAINAPVAIFFGLKVATVSSVGAVGLSAITSLITK